MRRVNTVPDFDQFNTSMQTIMSLLVVLIPVLLVTADFCQIGILETSHTGRGAQRDRRQDHAQTDERPVLTVLVSDSTVTLAVGDILLPSHSYTRIRGTPNYDDAEYRIAAAPADTASSHTSLVSALRAQAAMIQSRLAQKSANIPVIIASDARVPYETIITLMDSMNESGFGDIGLARFTKGH